MSNQDPEVPDFVPREGPENLDYPEFINTYYSPGNWVTYIPSHADGDINHPDCEHGVVSSINQYNDEIVFVWYHQGDTAAGTNVRDLVLQWPR